MLLQKWVDRRAAGPSLRLQGVTTESVPFCLQQLAPRARVTQRRVDRDLFIWTFEAATTMATPILPPDLTAGDFADALEAFRRIVGSEHVYIGEALSAYVDPYSIAADPDAHATPAAVAPDSAEQVQAILKIANQYKVPLWPISCGKNHGYGGAAPRMPGTVVLDLNRMNRILEVNVESGYALVEPGVSYFDLYRYLQEKGIKLWLDVPDPGWGSVLAMRWSAAWVTRPMAITS